MRCYRFMLPPHTREGVVCPIIRCPLSIASARLVIDARATPAGSGYHPRPCQRRFVPRPMAIHITTTESRRYGTESHGTLA